MRCTRSRGPRGFFCLQVVRRGPVNAAVIPLRQIPFVQLEIQMKNKTKHVTITLSIAMLCLLVGFTIGQRSKIGNSHARVTSGDELLLVGKWEMKIVGDEEPWTIEFRSDRTTTRYNPDGSPSIVATWGIVDGELQIQNAQNGDADGYMGPTILKIANLDNKRVDLTSTNNTAQFVLKKLL